MLPHAVGADRRIVAAAVAANGRTVVTTHARAATGVEQGLYLADPLQATGELPLMDGITVTITSAGPTSEQHPPANF